MSDRQELIDWLRHWKHEVPTTREREEMIEAMRDAATALEEAQGVPREAPPSNLRMDAYYYGFGSTGNPWIDKILSAVACAGKAYHHTHSWSDETRPYEGHSGDTPVDWIQNAANEAAAAHSAPAAPTREHDPGLCKNHNWWDPINQSPCPRCSAPTREPVSTPRDEQDAKRYRFLREFWIHARHGDPDGKIAITATTFGLDDIIDAALAEPKR